MVTDKNGSWWDLHLHAGSVKGGVSEKSSKQEVGSLIGGSAMWLWQCFPESFPCVWLVHQTGWVSCCGFRRMTVTVFSRKLSLCLACSPNRLGVLLGVPPHDCDTVFQNAFPVSGLFTTHLLSLDALLTVVDSIEQHCHRRILSATKSAPAAEGDALQVEGAFSCDGIDRLVSRSVSCCWSNQMPSFTLGQTLMCTGVYQFVSYQITEEKDACVLKLFHFCFLSLPPSLFFFSFFFMTQ